MNQMQTRIHGIPAVIRWDIDGHFFAQTENTPAEYPEVVIEICDRRGRPAPWLERKLTETELNGLKANCWEAS